MWSSLAAIKDGPRKDDFIKFRDEIASKLTPSQLAASQTMSQRCLDTKYTDCGPTVGAQPPSLSPLPAKRVVPTSPQTMTGLMPVMAILLPYWFARSWRGVVLWSLGVSVGGLLLSVPVWWAMNNAMVARGLRPMVLSPFASADLLAVWAIGAVTALFLTLTARAIRGTRQWRNARGPDDDVTEETPGIPASETLARKPSGEASPNLILKKIGASVVVLAVVAVLFSKVIGAFIGKTAVEQISNQVSIGETEGALAEIQRQIVREIQPTLPIKIDDFISLTTVAAVGPTVLYGYRVEKLPAGFDIDAFRRTRTSWLKNQACTSPTERKAMELGANYRFIYNEQDGVNLAEITIALASCDNIGH